MGDINELRDAYEERNRSWAKADAEGDRRRWVHAGWADMPTIDGRVFTGLRIDPNRFPFPLTQMDAGIVGQVTDAYVDGHGAVFIETGAEWDEDVWVPTIAVSGAEVTQDADGVLVVAGGTLMGVALTPLDGWPWITPPATAPTGGES